MNTLLLTAHDYRTPRKANLHFIAEQLVALGGPTRFFSLRYSWLSRWKQDPRVVLDDRANRVERVEGVDCYLWKPWLHPFNMRRPVLRPLEDLWFRQHVASAPKILEQWMREADCIFFESGSAIQFFELAERVNLRARKIYIGSDDLAVIGVADHVARAFERVSPRMTAVCLTSAAMADRVPFGTRNFVVPHGIDHAIAERADPSPYPVDGNRHAVSVGSMLFDRSFFDLAGPMFPDTVFHVIGSGMPDREGLPSNVRVYDEMPHGETLRFIKHADAGIAPYRGDDVPPYLADTSMKMMQYEFFGVPAVCPFAVCGGMASRFGYRSGSADSIANALRAAFAAGRFEPRAFLGWDEVVQRLLEPERFAELRLEATT